ncbi:MAG: hypothetical protein GXW85_11310 [Clostridia bacterium]|nr:hypothetical protein [Clostridia bacterium]
MEQVLKLNNFLAENKETLLNRWFHLVLEAYPTESAKHFGNLKSQFGNPVGFNIYEGLGLIYDELLQSKVNEENMFKALDKILRIMAVQNVPPSQAVRFMFKLKNIVREAVKKELAAGKLVEDLLIFEDKIDQTVLLGFNIYLNCRETIYKIRLHEVKTRCDMLERINQYNN